MRQKNMIWEKIDTLVYCDLMPLNHQMEATIQTFEWLDSGHSQLQAKIKQSKLLNSFLPIPSLIDLFYLAIP